MGWKGLRSIVGILSVDIVAMCIESKCIEFCELECTSANLKLPKS